MSSSTFPQPKMQMYISLYNPPTFIVPEVVLLDEQRAEHLPGDLLFCTFPNAAHPGQDQRLFLQLRRRALMEELLRALCVREDQGDHHGFSRIGLLSREVDDKWEDGGGAEQVVLGIERAGAECD